MQIKLDIEVTKSFSHVQAVFGACTVTAPDMKELRAKIARMVEHMFRNYHSFAITAQNGDRWVLGAHPQGYDYRTPSGCICSLDMSLSRDEAIAKMCEHMYQYYSE